MLEFTHKKFLALSDSKKHKQCAYLARCCYELMVNERPFADSLRRYEQLAGWLDLPAIRNQKGLSDRYHWHNQRAGVNKKEHNFLPKIRSHDRLEGEEPWDIAIYLDHLRSAHNVGSIIRTAEAMALGKIYFSRDTPFIDNKQVKDAAMHTDQWVPCFKEIPLSQLKKPIIALETATGAHNLYDFSFPSAFTLVVGNEEYGCSDETLQLADEWVEIPLRGRKNSLNVANAFAIAAGEIARQKNLVQHEKN